MGECLPTNWQVCTACHRIFSVLANEPLTSLHLEFHHSELPWEGLRPCSSSNDVKGCHGDGRPSSSDGAGGASGRSCLRRCRWMALGTLADASACASSSDGRGMLADAPPCPPIARRGVGCRQKPGGRWWTLLPATGGRPPRQTALGMLADVPTHAVIIVRRGGCQRTPPLSPPSSDGARGVGGRPPCAVGDWRTLPTATVGAPVRSIVSRHPRPRHCPRTALEMREDAPLRAIITARRGGCRRTLPLVPPF